MYGADQLKNLEISFIKKISKQIALLNERYQDLDIYFPIYESYEVTYLKDIQSFLALEIKTHQIEFRQGKGSRKNASTKGL